MTLSRDEFGAFFAAVNDGHSPFAWQQRLLDHLLDHGRWPDRITSPTGSGKTSVIDVHVFAVALTAGGTGPRLPRRLAMVVGRRVLVDDQHQRATALAKQLAATAGGGDPASTDVVARVAFALRALHPTCRPSDLGLVVDDFPTASGAPLVVARLRGGAAPSRSWRDHLSACAVICATPDMWGSRLLFRGYGTSSRAAPREAGALAFDSVVVIDEAHLAGQLLVTAKRVANLMSVADLPLSGVPRLQVIETTATPGKHVDSAISIGVESTDLDEPALSPRLTRPKPVTLLPVPSWPPPHKKPDAAAQVLAAAVLDLLAPSTGERRPGPRTVGCFVNSVPMASAVTKFLRAGRRPGAVPRVVMVSGQTRPADLHRLTERYPGIFTPAGDEKVDVIVTTQSLEVGVDLDLAAVVSELAPASALAQRAGRVNRRGLRAEGRVVIAVPADPLTDKARSGPYGPEELIQALEWVDRRRADPDGMAPWALRGDPPPPAPRRRALYQRPELADAWHWAMTSDALAAEPELDLWLAESFESETSIGVVVRDAMPDDNADAVALVRALPPLPYELFPVPYPTARSVLASLVSRQLGEGLPPLIRVRGEDTSALQPTGSDDDVAVDVRPGDVVVVDSRAAIFSEPGEGDAFSPQIVVEDAPGHRADDVLHQYDPQRRRVALRLHFGETGERVAGLSLLADDVPGKELAEALTEATAERERRQSLQAFLAGLVTPPHDCTAPARAMVEAATALLGGAVKASDVLVSWRENGTLAHVLVLDRRRAGADEELRQVFTPRTDGQPVTLDVHQAAVADRAHVLASLAGLPESLREALRIAGAHHDDGKADPRFQVRLGRGADSDITLAKSDPRSTVRQVRERELRAGLPRSWRHEQRSVLEWLDRSASDPALCPDGVDTDLVSRLVGTSHGHGRCGFPQSGRHLLHAAAPQLQELAVDVFDDGGWDALIERTQTRYGVWGCAYLEAVLRAADGQVSGEGS